MKIKMGRKEFEVTEKDVIMYNGACYQLMTQYITDGWGREISPVLAVAKAKKLIKDNILIEAERTISTMTKVPLIYYKFNV